MGLARFARPRFIVSGVTFLIGLALLVWWTYDWPRWSKGVAGSMLFVAALYGLIDAFEEDTRK